MYNKPNYIIIFILPAQKSMTECSCGIDSILVVKRAKVFTTSDKGNIAKHRPMHINN